MRAIGDRLPHLDLDVIAFQEVWTNEAQRTLVDAGHRAGLVHGWHNDASFGNSGLLVLSRLPIVGIRFEAYAIRGAPERLTHVDFLGGKGFAEVRIETAIGPVTIVDTHLQAGYPVDVRHSYRAQRVGQIVQLAVRLREIREPIIALGDFNFEDTSPEYEVLSGLTGLVDAGKSVGGLRPTLSPENPYRVDRPERRRIDLIYLRDAGSLRVRARSVALAFDEGFDIDGQPATYSDHRGVLAELELDTRGAATPSPVDPAALALAGELLRDGRVRARERRRAERGRLFLGVSAATVALVARSRLATRRRFLRASLLGAGLVAAGPATGLSILTERLLPDEIDAFEALETEVSGFSGERQESRAVRPRPVDAPS